MKFLAPSGVAVENPTRPHPAVFVTYAEIEVTNLHTTPIAAYCSGRREFRGTIKGTTRNQFAWVEAVFEFTPMLSRYSPGMVELARDRRRR